MWWRAPSVLALQQVTEQTDASANLPPCNKPTLCFIFGVSAGACIEVSCIKSTAQTRWHCSCVDCRGKDSSRRNQQPCNPPHLLSISPSPCLLGFLKICARQSVYDVQDCLDRTDYHANRLHQASLLERQMHKQGGHHLRRPGRAASPSQAWSVAPYRPVRFFLALEDSTYLPNEVGSVVRRLQKQGSVC